MNKQIKSGLIEYFEAPAPSKKEEFLNSFNKYKSNNTTIENHVTYRTFMLSQIKYIRKWVWAASVIFFSLALLSARYFETDILWRVSSFMPVLALAVVTESGRSENYGMAEFEISTKFSLRAVILARLTILGITNLITVCLLLSLIAKNSNADMFITAMYIFCPYLLTSFLGLLLTRKIHGKEAAYICVGIAALVSVCNITVYQIFPHIFETAYSIWWTFAFILLAAGCANELYKKIQMTEELLWSLY